MKKSKLSLLFAIIFLLSSVTACNAYYPGFAISVEVKKIQNTENGVRITFDRIGDLNPCERGWLGTCEISTVQLRITKVFETNPGLVEGDRLQLNCAVDGFGFTIQSSSCDPVLNTIQKK